MRKEPDLGLLECIQTAQVLGTAVEMRDYGTEAHCLRVALYAGALGEEMDLGQATMRPLLSGAFLHDVGKIGIPDHVLLKAEHRLSGKARPNG